MVPVFQILFLKCFSPLNVFCCLWRLKHSSCKHKKKKTSVSLAHSPQRYFQSSHQSLCSCSCCLKACWVSECFLSHKVRQTVALLRQLTLNGEKRGFNYSGADKNPDLLTFQRVWGGFCVCGFVPRVFRDGLFPFGPLRRRFLSQVTAAHTSGEWRRRHASGSDSIQRLSIWIKWGQISAFILRNLKHKQTTGVGEVRTQESLQESVQITVHVCLQQLDPLCACPDSE